MRDNTRALIEAGSLTLETGKSGKPWGVLTFPSVSAFQAAVKAHACTSNERAWGEDSHWIGLGPQSYQDFRETGVAKHPLELTKKTLATLPQRVKGFTRPISAVTGSAWDVPSVLANIPLSARTRARKKLAPLNIRIAAFFSAGISAESLAPLTAKLAQALYAYTQAGGAVTLTVGFISSLKSEDGSYKQGFVGAKVNAADLSNLSTILSPVGFRALGGRALTAFCAGSNNPTRGFETSNDLPNTYVLSGVLSEVFTVAEQVFKALEIKEG